MSFDKIAAIYVYCEDYHSGQWSRLYRLLCRISRQYKIKLSAFDYNDIRYGGYDPGPAHDIYQSLVNRKAE